MTYSSGNSYPPAGVPNSNSAMISLIAGILGLTLVPFIGSIVAVVTGNMARREIRDSGGSMGGDGMATAGLVLGWIGIGLGVLTICIIAVIFAASFAMILFAVQESSGLLPLLMSFV